MTRAMIQIMILTCNLTCLYSATLVLDLDSMSNMAHCILYIAGALFIAIVIVYHELNFCYFQVQSAKTKYLLFFQRQKTAVSCGIWHMAYGRWQPRFPGRSVGRLENNFPAAHQLCQEKLANTME